MNSEKRNEELLREASALGDEDAIRKLIECGVDVNSQHSMNGWTGLHWAAKRGHASIVRLLLSHGADPSLTSVYGESSFAVAKNEDIHNILSGNSECPFEYQAKSPLPITPNYISNPALAPKIDKEIRSSDIVHSNSLVENESKRKYEEALRAPLSGSINEYQACLGTKYWGFRFELIETSAHVPLRPKVTYTEMGSVGLMGCCSTGFSLYTAGQLLRTDHKLLCSITLSET
ncbi:ankyrin repeat domain-containing protein 40 [Trichonephila clavipes]|nr:ankyrin repeat domain-containing protein 40 [Trichonephila clavipes]